MAGRRGERRVGLVGPAIGLAGLEQALGLQRAAIEVATLEGELQAAAADHPDPRHHLLAIERQAAADDPPAMLVEEGRGDTHALTLHLLATRKRQGGGLGEAGGQALGFLPLRAATRKVLDLAPAAGGEGRIGAGGLALGLGEAAQLIAAKGLGIVVAAVGERTGFQATAPFKGASSARRARRGGGRVRRGRGRRGHDW
jgi:hypothetical protein